ncbi:F-box protein At1g10110-like [Silene latifolia]|uniref:F-box protein At1g10110-like n=1 Tax=Silene latifolia TaxID=37657 RepID=UPI003D783B83
MAADWSAMTVDVLGVIALKLEAIEDFIYFSVVCRSWNSVATLIKNEWRAVPTPWLLLAENNTENPNCLRKVFNLENKKCYEMSLPETFGARCWGSAYGWVAMVDRNLDIQLFNPISKARIQFPSLETIPGLKLYDENIDKTKDDYIDRCLNVFLTNLVVLKVSQGVRHELDIVAFYSKKRVALARPGDQSWTSINVVVFCFNTLIIYRP